MGNTLQNRGRKPATATPARRICPRADSVPAAQLIWQEPTHVEPTHVGPTHVGTAHVGTAHVGMAHVGTAAFGRPAEAKPSGPGTAFDASLSPRAEPSTVVLHT